MTIEKVMKWIRIAFAFLFGAGLMSYAAYGWHIEWLNDWQALIAGTIGSAFTFAPHKVVSALGKFIPRLFELTIGRFFNSGGGKASLIALMILASISAYAQNKPVNTPEVRLLEKTDSTLISGTGQHRWDAATGKHRFGDGTQWFSFRKDTDPAGISTASNGLNIVGSDVQLGGPTEIADPPVVTYNDPTDISSGDVTNSVGIGISSGFQFRAIDISSASGGNGLVFFDDQLTTLAVNPNKVEATYTHNTNGEFTSFEVGQVGMLAVANDTDGNYAQVQVSTPDSPDTPQIEFFLNDATTASNHTATLGLTGFDFIFQDASNNDAATLQMDATGVKIGTIASGDNEITLTNSGVTNAVSYPLTVRHENSSYSNGFGTGIKLELSPLDIVGAAITSQFESTSIGSEDTDMRLKVTRDAVLGDGLVITSDKRVYGTALHNNTGAITGTTNQYIASGTYTPTLTATDNVASLTAYACQYIRVGNVVTVSGKADVTFSSAAAAFEFAISLPIATALSAEGQCAGAANPREIETDMDPAVILGDVSNDRALLMSWTKTISGKTMVWNFTYTIL